MKAYLIRYRYVSYYQDKITNAVNEIRLIYANSYIEACDILKMKYINVDNFEDLTL